MAVRLLLFVCVHGRAPASLSLSLSLCVCACACLCVCVPQSDRDQLEEELQAATDARHQWEQRCGALEDEVVALREKLGRLGAVRKSLEGQLEASREDLRGERLTRRQLEAEVASSIDAFF